MKTASWVLLFVVGLAFLVVGFISAGVAYGGGEWPIGPSSLSKVEAAIPGTAVPLRGARGTAAAFGAAFGTLWLTVVMGPYRRGEAWAWWGLLGAVLVLSAVILVRVPLIGSNLGVPTALIPLVVALLGLLLDLSRVRGGR
jgi:hypothetical protein